ncbi:hypothetical protein CRENBAI_020686 [Crenichthys baileyi]|uniref:Secreted protein n=1 Tax=Crenichthys baileyi TaxID=28760 RepID=A0AAV9S016_9TELE
MPGSGRLCLLFCLLLTVFYPRWHQSMVVGSCGKCIASSLISGEYKRSLLPALRPLSVNQLWLLQCPGFRSISLPSSKASKSSSPDKFPASGVLAPRSVSLIHKRTLLTLHRTPHP